MLRMMKPTALGHCTRNPFTFSLQPHAKRQIIFVACILFVLSVSIYDSLLVVRFQETILLDERNPVCTMLINQDPDKLSWFLMGKTLGNVFVVSILVALFRFRYRHVMTVTTAMAVFQLTLLTFLTCSDPQTGFLSFDGLLSHDPVIFHEAVILLMVHTAGLLAILSPLPLLIWLKTNRKRLVHQAKLASP